MTKECNPICAEWFDGKGHGPTQFALRLDTVPVGTPRLVIALISAHWTNRDLIDIPAHRAVLDGGLSLERRAVAALHQQLGDWIEKNP